MTLTEPSNAPPAASAAGRAGVSFASPLLFEGVEHAYGDQPTLRGLTLAAPAGEITCLLGPSGSGKTTLLRIAAGLERSHGGRVLVSDREVAGPTRFVEPERRGISYMFQDFALFPHMTVLQNVAFGLGSLPRARAMDAARAALSRVGLGEMADRYPDMLSGGQQQRVALARALAPRPGILLMDEPFSGLDARLRDAVRADALNILRETRATAIVVTHDAGEAMRMGDRIALLREGRLVQQGTARELYRAPVDLFTARFFSDLNVLPAIVRRGVADTPLGPLPAKGTGDGPAEIALRPGAFEIDESSALRARVVVRRFLGDVEAFTLALEGRNEPLRATFREGTIAPGATHLRLRVRAGEVLAFESPGGSA